MEQAWWVEPEPPWRACLDAAWESFCHGSLPVGAVVVDADGEVVATGRNRQRELEAPPPQLAGCNLAHAEINALVALPRGDYSSHTLFSTLQPCLLCTGAICHTHIGSVRYAAADPIFAGIERLPELNSHIARRWPSWDGPHDSSFALWSQLLTFVFAARDDPTLLSRSATRSAGFGSQAREVSALAPRLDAFTSRPLAAVLVDGDVAALVDAFAVLVADWWPKRPAEGS